MTRIALPIILFALALIAGPSSETRAQGAQPCSTVTEPEATTITPALFYPVKPPAQGTLRRRDLEFQWDSQYDTLGTVGFFPNDEQTLNRLGITCAELPAHNPFGANLSDIHLVYEYFRADTTPVYNTDPFAPSGIVVGLPDYSFAVSCQPPPCPTTAPSSERGHVDHYLSSPKRGFGAQYPSAFYTAKEDSSSTPTQWINDNNWTAWSTNSIMTHGPANASVAARTDPNGTGWTRPGGHANVGFCHEFQHSLSKIGSFTWPLDEIFGLGAEAIAGNPLPPSNFDVSYVLGLISIHQQQHKWMFACYLAYNFRGTDTTATLTGFQDDLLFRWAKGDRHLYALRPLLSDAICAECSPTLKPYFHPGGVPLDDHSRLQLLLHNYRVANFVNNSSLDHGQYGYPPQFGFTPKDNAGAWQSRDGSGPNDVHAIPPEVVARPAMVVRETTMVGTRYSAAGSFPMSLQMFGSEYWVVRADPALGSTPRDLMVRVSPERIYRCNFGTPDQHDGRLMASVVGYSVPAESLSTGQLWAHPEWAVQALAPIWVDVDNVAGGLELVLPGFGTSVNAAVLVISFGDGPSGNESGLDIQGGFEGFFPYRLNLALRTAPFLSPNPGPLLTDAGQTDESPTWSPLGAEVALVRRDPATGVSGIYRKSLDASPPVLLGTAGTETRADPDWSPRGDWIAFSRGATAGFDAHVWAVNRWSQELRQLTSGAGQVDESPAFEPHGQRIAYLRSSYSGPPGPETLNARQVRRVNLDGSGDMLLAEISLAGEDGSLRWTPDGRFVYYTHDGTLFTVPADGGCPTARPSLLTGAVSFDFHRGQGALLVEQTGVMPTRNEPCGLPGLPFHRFALRDTLANDTQARFYQTGAEFYRPRWSPDGTRIAYGSNQNTAGDRDLFIGQVSFNRAPQFQVLNDRVIAAGPAFEMEVFASDPDGEPLTFDAPSRYLPAGASFNPATHRFTWPNPGPAMSEHFVVFRVMDGSGGVATQVVRFSVTAPAIADLNPDLVGSHEVWLTWTAPGTLGGPSAVEYDLRYAPYAITEGTFAIASRAWDAPTPAPPGSAESHMIGGLQACTPYWFAIKSKDAGGSWSPISNVPMTSTLCGGGGGGETESSESGPVLAGLEPGIAEAAGVQPRGTDSTRVALAVEMAGTASAPRWSVHFLPDAERAALSAGDSLGVVLQRPDEVLGWRERTRLVLPEKGWRFGLRALRRPARLVFLGANDQQQAWNAVAAGDGLGAVTLTSARHSRLGDLTAAIGIADGYHTGLSAGDTLHLAYEPAGEAVASAQPWFMVVGPPGETSEAQGFRRQALGQAPATPTAFALRQNRPNPFSGTTEIRFELPVASAVRLEVFDAQGRLVRTLADHEFPAGFHAVIWDQRDAAGARVRAGIYLYRITAEGFRSQRKMTVL